MCMTGFFFQNNNLIYLLDTGYAMYFLYQHYIIEHNVLFYIKEYQTIDTSWEKNMWDNKCGDRIEHEIIKVQVICYI